MAADCCRGVHAGAAEAVYRGATDTFGQSREQGTHTGNIAVILARLVRIAIDDIIDLFPIDGRIAVHQGLDRDRPKVIRADSRQAAAITANRGSNCITDIRVFHFSFLSLRPGIICPLMV